MYSDPSSEDEIPTWWLGFMDRYPRLDKIDRFVNLLQGNRRQFSSKRIVKGTVSKNITLS